jgi:hypothetical protein
MKRNVFVSVVSLLIAAALLFTACGQSKAAHFQLSADKTEYAPGDEVTVTVTLSDLERVAWFDLAVTYDLSELTLVSSKGGNQEDFVLETIDKEGKTVISGFSATTYSFTSETIATLVFRVNEGVTGAVTIHAAPTAIEIGKDDRGDETEDISSRKDLASSLTFTVVG